jgi:hypothetical protein
MCPQQASGLRPGIYMESSEAAGKPRRWLRVIVPNLWQGEWPCLVGPFSGRVVAEYFADRVVEFGHFEAVRERVFARQDSYYVQVARWRKALGSGAVALRDPT